MPDMNMNQNNANSPQQIAANCLTFLQRADLKGAEANAFAECCNWLIQIANPNAVMPTNRVRPLSAMTEDELNALGEQARQGAAKAAE